MKSVYTRCLVVLMLSLASFPSFSESDSEYGDIIRNTPEYEKITKPKNEEDKPDFNFYYPYHYPYSYPYDYPWGHPAYYRPASSKVPGLPGTFYLGVSIGKSEFDYNDNKDGDASVFRLGYRPENSHLGYELSFFNSGDSEITSLTDIDLDVDSLNLLLTLNTSRDIRSRLNLFSQGGIYFAQARLDGPFDSVSESSNGFLLVVGIEMLLNRHFSLRAEALNLFEVDDFANDESISSLILGGNIIF